MTDQPASSSVLGRLERVDVRLAWLAEATDFTPWLARPENISLLGEAIGLDLQVETQEAPVGPFRADILCKDTLNDHYVLVENQLERTDHTHLGQLLTYAAGLDAVTIVWVAARFTDEHRAALDWLNRATGSAINFFGLEIELWRIGNSPLAPKFNVVSQPNDWVDVVQQSAAAATSLSPIQQLHLEFWGELKRFLETKNSAVRIGKPAKDHWTGVALGRSYFTLILANGMRDNNSTLQVSLTGPDAKRNFRMLESSYKTTIEGVLGPVEWRELPNNKESQIRLIKATRPSDKTTWTSLVPWMAEQAERWAAVFRPIVSQFDLSDVSSDEIMLESEEGDRNEP